MSNMKQETSDHKDADNVVIKDAVGQSVRQTRQVNGIGYAAGTSVGILFAADQSIYAYRIKNTGSVVLRVTEDAVNQAQAEAWLNTGAADTPSVSANQNHYKVPVGEWSEWQVFPEGIPLSSIWCSLDAAGTNQTAEVEAI